MAYEGLFIREGDRYRATPNAIGPWSREALHGGPPAALIARVLGQAANAQRAEHPLQLARLTLELVRPVPLTAVAIEVIPVRPGRRVTLLDAIMRTADGVEVCRARALFLTPSGADATAQRPPPFAAPEDSVANDWPAGEPMFVTDGMELRFAAGGFRTVGPATGWFRLRLPLIAGQPPDPLDVAIAAADFGNGIAPAVSWEGHTFINPDLTVFLERPPIDEWVAVQAATRVQQGSVASAESVLWDRRGRLGRAVQTLLIATR